MTKKKPTSSVSESTKKRKRLARGILGHPKKKKILFYIDVNIFPSNSTSLFKKKIIYKNFMSFPLSLL